MQAAWSRDDLQVIVATIAFGMGARLRGVIWGLMDHFFARAPARAAQHCMRCTLLSGAAASAPAPHARARRLPLPPLPQASTSLMCASSSTTRCQSPSRATTRRRAGGGRGLVQGIMLNWLLAFCHDRLAACAGRYIWAWLASAGGPWQPPDIPSPKPAPPPTGGAATARRRSACCSTPTQTVRGAEGRSSRGYAALLPARCACCRQNARRCMRWASLTRCSRLASPRRAAPRPQPRRGAT